MLQGVLFMKKQICFPSEKAFLRHPCMSKNIQAPEKMIETLFFFYPTQLIAVKIIQSP